LWGGVRDPGGGHAPIEEKGGGIGSDTKKRILIESEDLSHRYLARDRLTKKRNERSSQGGSSQNEWSGKKRALGGGGGSTGEGGS